MNNVNDLTYLADVLAYAKHQRDEMSRDLEQLITNARQMGKLKTSTQMDAFSKSYDVGYINGHMSAYYDIIDIIERRLNYKIISAENVQDRFKIGDEVWYFATDVWITVSDSGILLPKIYKRFICDNPVFVADKYCYHTSVDQCDNPKNGIDVRRVPENWLFKTKEAALKWLLEQYHDK